MSNSPYIVIANSRNFAEAVIEKSQQVPVLVDFWADWCVPCKTLLPVLTQLATEYQGKFILAKINTDEERELATQYNVRNIPNLKLFRHGKMMEEVVGVQLEATFRALIDRHREREADKLRFQALEAYRQGEIEQALEWLEQARDRDPTYYVIHQDLMQIFIDLQRFEEAEQLLKSLPVNVQTEPEFSELSVQLKFAVVVAKAPSHDELVKILRADSACHLARYQLAIRLSLLNEHEAALQQLLELLKRDRHFQEEAARKAMVEIFQILGNRGELVTRYRSKMSALLY